MIYGLYKILLFSVKGTKLDPLVSASFLSFFTLCAKISIRKEILNLPPSRCHVTQVTKYPITATFQQRPLSFVPWVAVVGRFHCIENRNSQIFSKYNTTKCFLNVSKTSQNVSYFWFTKRFLITSAKTFKLF